MPNPLQTKSTKGVGVTSVAVTPTSAITAGSLLVVAVSGWARAATAGKVTDTRNPAATLDKVADGTNAHCALYSAPNAAAGSTTITYAPTGAAQDTDIAVLEYASMATSTPADQSGNSVVNSGATTSWPCGTTGTTTQADELVVFVAAGEGNSSVPTAPAGATLREHIETTANMPIMTADKTVAATGTQTGTFTNVSTNFPNVGVVVTYKIAGAAADPFPLLPGRGLSPLYRM